MEAEGRAYTSVTVHLHFTAVFSNQIEGKGIGLYLIKGMVENNGGKILSGVSSKLNFLVVGDDAGSKLEKAKKIPAIKILSEDEFLKMMNG